MVLYQIESWKKMKDSIKKFVTTAILTNDVLWENEVFCDEMTEIGSGVWDHIKKAIEDTNDVVSLDSGVVMENLLHELNNVVGKIVTQATYLDKKFDTDLDIIESSKSGTTIILVDNFGNESKWLKTDLDRLVNLSNGHVSDYEEIESYLKECSIKK